MNSSTGFIALDIHICGACRKQFSDVDEFVEHKKNGCPVLLSLQQSGTQSGVSQAEVNNDNVSAGDQLTQTSTNRFTIPLPSIQVQDAAESHQEQDPCLENQYQVQHVSSTEEVGYYGSMTENGLQTIQNREYTEMDDHEILQQPIGHEYIRTQNRRTKYCLQVQEDHNVQQPSDKTNSTSILTGSQVVISQYQTSESDYVLQQVNQSEAVYDDRLVQLEGQPAVPPEPVYTLETHEEPLGSREGRQPHGNYGVPNTVNGGDNELNSLPPVNVTVSGISSSLSFDSQLPATFSLQNNGTGGKVFQQKITISQASNTVALNTIDAQVPYILNDTSPAKLPAKHLTNSSTTLAQSKQVTSQKTPPSRHEMLSRILTRPEQGVDKLQQEKSSKKLPFKDTDTKGNGTKTAPEKKFTCSYEDCNFRTAYMKDLERHNRIHTGEKPFTCAQCGKSFNRNDKLILHLRYHSGDKSFKCQLCDYSCVESGSLKKHMRIHSEERPFKCQVCPYSSRSSGQLQIHLRIHTGDKPYMCVICSAAFKVTSDLKRHMRIHTGEKPYRCEHCDYKCSVKGNLKSHMRVNHSSYHEVECHACDYKSSSKKALREHLKLHETNDELTCKVCKYQCASKSALKNHMLRHNSEASLVKCNFCDYKTRQVGNVVAHMKRKHPSRVMQRKKIGQIYRKLNKGHVPYVEDTPVTEPSNKVKARCKKMFKCTMCDNSFVREDSLKCHMKQHRDLSKSSLSTAYAVLKLQQPVVNVGTQQGDSQDVTETVDPENLFIPSGAIAVSQVQPQSGTANTIQSQTNSEATSSQGHASNLGIKDILAAAGLSNGIKDIVSGVTSSPNLVLNSSPLVTNTETSPTNAVSNITIAQSPQDVPTVQVMQNISLPYIRLPDGQILVLGQTPLTPTVPANVSPRKTTTNIQQDRSPEQSYPVTLQPVPIPQQVSNPMSSPQSGAIPIQIIVPSDSQHSMPLVTQLLNNGQNLPSKQIHQTGSSSETHQNYVVHIPSNPGNITKPLGPETETQSQSYVLQIPGSGPSFGINMPDLLQNLDRQASVQVVQINESQGSEDPLVSN